MHSYLVESQVIQTGGLQVYEKNPKAAAIKVLKNTYKNFDPKRLQPYKETVKGTFVRVSLLGGTRESEAYYTVV